jgi:glycosyltransferase involved in cell wall biosynthesis
MVHGRLPAAVARADASLVLEQSGERLSLPSFPEAYAPATEVPVHRGWSRLRSLARRRGWRGALVAALRGLRRRLHLAAQPELPTAVHAARGGVLVLDHGMGGGANRYRQERVALLRAAGCAVVQVESELSSLSYRVRVLPPRGEALVELRLETFDALLAFVEGVEAQRIEVNNLVGFEDVPMLLERLLALKRRDPSVRMRFNLHDFHAACPAFTLIDAGGAHCGVPALEACRRCLPANARHSLGMNAGIVVEEWRGAWAAFLDAADERVAFSASSLALLAKALPTLRTEGWRVEPHVVDAREFRPVAPRLEPPVVVVAVGHLNHAKGATLLADLARRAAERALPLRFTVVGTVEGESPEPRVRVTGAFERGALCGLLEAEGAGIAFVPSICPETYSYVTDELMATGLPLAVLDIGAPAERVARYDRGLVLPRQGLDEQLDALLGFASALRRGG